MERIDNSTQPSTSTRNVYGISTTDCNVLRVNYQNLTKNNGIKLETFRFRREIGRKLFSNVVDEWSGHKNHIISAEATGVLKEELYKDDRWNEAAVLTQGLPRIGLTASCSFPDFLMYLCSSRIAVKITWKPGKQKSWHPDRRTHNRQYSKQTKLTDCK